jgi:hypothetical protein
MIVNRDLEAWARAVTPRGPARISTPTPYDIVCLFIDRVDCRTKIKWFLEDAICEKSLSVLPNNSCRRHRADWYVTRLRVMFQLLDRGDSVVGRHI